MAMITSRSFMVFVCGMDGADLTVQRLDWRGREDRALDPSVSGVPGWSRKSRTYPDHREKLTSKPILVHYRLTMITAFG
jgi:hypothetical protein